MPTLVKRYIYHTTSLAFVLQFCHAEYVKKYFLFIFFVITFLQISPQQVTAAGIAQEGEVCSALANAGNLSCAPEFKCNTTDFDDRIPAVYRNCGPIPAKLSICPVEPFYGLCERIQGETLNCACMTEGATGKEQNGFKCSTETDPARIKSDPNAQTVYCNTPDLACKTASGALDMKTGYDLGKTSYNGKILQGVRCEAPKKFATCTCIGTGTSGQNNFECTTEGTTEKGTGFCKNPQAKCTNASDPNAVADPNNFSSYGGFLDTAWFSNGYDIRGITCDSQNNNITKRLYPTLPPPPPPPCAQPIGADGTCSTFATAVGNLETAPEKFISSLFAVLLSISGGIALLLIIKAGYQMLVSQGKPESINNARDQLVAAIVGLIFLILSFVILEIIGFDILQIPGFGA